MSVEITKRARTRRSTIGLAAAAGAFLMGAGAVSAANSFFRAGANDSGAALACPGGISRLGHVLNENASIFPGDPKTKIKIVATVPQDGYLVEKITIGSHTGTHLDAPAHFIESGRGVDGLTAEELVWPVYVIDVRGRLAGPGADDFQLSVEEVAAALGLDPDPDPEAEDQLEPNSIVVLVTGFEGKFGTEAYHNPIPGLSGAAVQFLFDEGASALGTDNFGPDASSDELFDATYTALANDGVVIPDLNNVADNLRTGDLIIASPVALENGSSFPVDPLACHG